MRHTPHRNGGFRMQCFAFCWGAELLGRSRWNDSRFHAWWRIWAACHWPMWCASGILWNTWHVATLFHPDLCRVAWKRISADTNRLCKLMWSLVRWFFEGWKDGQGPRRIKRTETWVDSEDSSQACASCFRFATAGWTAYAYFNPYGLKAIGDGMECLCHFATWNFQHILCISSWLKSSEFTLLLPMCWPLAPCFFFPPPRFCLVFCNDSDVIGCLRVWYVGVQDRSAMSSDFCSNSWERFVWLRQWIAGGKANPCCVPAEEGNCWARSLFHWVPPTTWPQRHRIWQCQYEAVGNNTSRHAKKYWAKKYRE